MINIISSNLQQYKKIVQISDIHVKLNKNHAEFREVFDNFYEELKKTSDDTLVVCTGDVFHSKINLEPECINLVSEIFNNIAKIREFVIIPGNHDGLVQNKNRLDSISPIINGLNHPNIYYLKNSGLYGFGNILFNVMGVFDDPDKYIFGKDIPAIYKNTYEHIIALFHGPIDGVIIDTGHRISNPSIMTPLFDGHHIAMCGDIHLPMNVQSYDPSEHKPIIRYVGSCIQQNHGEPYGIGHGYSLWDLKKRSYTHHELKNNYGYVTVEVYNGKLTTDISNLPKKTRLRIKHENSLSSDLNSVIATIKKSTEILETSYMKMDVNQPNVDISLINKNINLADLADVNYQNTLISEFIQSEKVNIKDSGRIDEILSINRKTNLLINKDGFSRNIRWMPIKLEFSNLFAYGEDNVIDFSKMNGIYGIFGKNALGKSSICSSLIYCLFDKAERSSKGSDVINSGKSSFRCKLEFEISGVRYFIERKGIRNAKTGSVKVDVRFWKLVMGVEEELHGTDRRDTNDIIRDYVGTYEDFILTTVSFQNAKNNLSFIDMGNSERKDLLVRFIGLDIFDRLYDAASERNKELNVIIKLHKGKNYQVELQQYQDLSISTTKMFTDIETEVNLIKGKLADINEKIATESSNLIKLDPNVPANIELVNSRKITAEEALNTKRSIISNNKKKLSEIENRLSDINREIQNIEESNLEENHKKYRELYDKLNEIKQKIDIKKVEVRGKLEQVARLSSHKYDPNCKYCIDNQFVKDANKAKLELSQDKVITDDLMKSLDSTKFEFDTLKWVEQSYEKYTELLTNRNKIKDEYNSLNKTIIVSTNELGILDASYNSILKQIELYTKNEQSVKDNASVYTKISTLKNELSKFEDEFRIQNKQLMDVSGKLEVYKSRMEALNKTIKELTDVEYESSLYQTYMLAVGRDGIPYQVICNAVPKIEKEVNSILSQIVNYSITFDTDGKNVTPYIQYPGKDPWIIELSSGFERFVSSMAIRMALTNISNLSHPNICIIDEGISALDPVNISQMPILMDILKANYDIVLIISHIDEIKDMVDKTIEIGREDDLAKVNFI